jgi:hypothetical protein
MQIKSNIYVKYLGVYFVYVSLIGVYYIQHPLQGSLFGNLDSWANLALFHELLNHFEAGFQGLDSGFLYPAKDSWTLYGLDFFTGVIWVIYKLFGLSDVWAYYAYIITLLSLNSIALYLLGTFIFQQRIFALLVGGLFSISPVLYENLINPNVLSYFFFFLALASMLKFIKDGGLKFLILAFLFASFQLYVSPVVFIFSAISLLVLILYNYRLFAKLSFFHLLVCGTISLLLISPYLYAYFFITKECFDVYAYFGDDAMAAFHHYLSLDIKDLLRFKPFNVIHDSFRFYDGNTLPIVSTKNLKFGVALSVLFIIGSGIILKKKIYRWMLLCFFIYLILGLAKYIYVSDDITILNPFYFILDFLGIYDILRIPARFGLPLYLMVLLIAVFGLEQLTTSLSWSNKKQWTWLFCILLIVEPLLLYANFHSTDQRYFELSTSLTDAAEKFSEGELVLFSPSGLFENQIDTREYVYMMINAQLHLNTVNGSAYCIPPERIALYETLNEEKLSADDFCNLLRERNIDKVILQNAMIFNESDKKQVQVILNANCLKEVFQLQDIIVYSTNL